MATKSPWNFFVWFPFLMGFSVNTSFWLQILLVLLSGDVEINPKRTLKATLSICHWNLNSISYKVRSDHPLNSKRGGVAFTIKITYTYELSASITYQNV